MRYRQIWMQCHRAICRTEAVSSRDKAILRPPELSLYRWEGFALSASYNEFACVFILSWAHIWKQLSHQVSQNHHHRLRSMVEYAHKSLLLRRIPPVYQTLSPMWLFHRLGFTISASTEPPYSPLLIFSKTISEDNRINHDSKVSNLLEARTISSIFHKPMILFV